LANTGDFACGLCPAGNRFGSGCPLGVSLRFINDRDRRGEERQGTVDGQQRVPAPIERLPEVGLLPTVAQSLVPRERIRLGSSISQFQALRQSSTIAAEASFRDAIALAERQSARLFQLRASTSSQGFGATRASTRKPVICSVRSTVGSPKISMRRT
jgi:hypothetical protein